jgi:hypothetical protein
MLLSQKKEKKVENSKLNPKKSVKHTKCLAHCCDCLFGEYWFCVSRYVYDGNRSFAPILRQSRWSLLYDIYWLEMMMLNTWTGTTGYFFCLTGNRQRDRNTWTRFRIRIVLFSFEQQISKESMKLKIIIEQWTR